MAINEVLGLSVNVSAKTDDFVKALQNAAKGAKLNINTSGMVDNFKSAQAQIKGMFAKTVAEAASVGLSKTKIEGFIKKFQPLTDEIEKSLKKSFRLDMAMRKAKEGTEKHDRIKALKAEEDMRLRMLHARLKQEQVGSEKILKRRREAIQEAERLAARTMTEAAEEAGESLEKAFNDIKGGNLGGLFKGAGKRAGAFGAGLQQKGEAKGGMMGEALKGIGGFLSKAGPMLMAIGAIAAGFAAVVAIVIQADAAVKDLNRTLLSSGVAGIEMVNQYGRLGGTMTKISQEFMNSFTFNRIWGTTAKDHLEILGAYAEAGVTFRNMTQGVTDAGKQMEILKQHTVAALTYSKLLGLSTKEISDAMGNYMTDLGFTIEGIEGKFSNLSRAALESGFATKRFFNMVLQATSGMSMYNVRLEEAASLLKDLGKILGQKMGGDMLQTLTKGFKDESTQDRIKKTMTTGVGYSLEVLKKDAVKSSEEFRRKMDDLGKTAAGADSKKAIENALDEVLGAGSSQKSPEELVKSMAKLSTAEQSKIIARAEASKNPAMVRMLTEIMNKSQAFGGKGLGSAQAARQFAGAGAVLDLQLNEVKGVLGKSLENIDLSDMTQRMAWEAITGKSGEEALKLFEVGKRFSGRHEVLSEEQAKIRKAAGRGEDTYEMARQFNQTFGKEFGVVLDEAGNRFKAQVDEAGDINIEKSIHGEGAQRLDDTRRDMLLTAGDELLGKGDSQVSEDIALAQEIAANTTDISKVLEQGVEYFLSKIYDAVQYIASFFGAKEFSEEEKKAKGLAQGDIQDKLNEVRKQMQLNQRAISTLEREAKSPRTSAERKVEIDAKIKEHQAVIQKLSSRSAVYSSAATDLGRLGADEARPFGDKLGVADFVSVAAAQPETKKLLEAELEKVAPGASMERRGAYSARYADIEKLADDYAFFTKQYTLDEAQPEAQRAQDMALRAQGAEKLGIGPAVQGVDNSWLSAWGLQGTDATGGVNKSTEEFLGKQYIKEKQDDVTLSKKEMTQEEKQKDKLAKAIIDGIAKDADDREDRQLAELLVRSGGMSGSPEEVIAAAHNLRTKGTIPMNMDPSRLVTDASGQQRRLAEVLLGSGQAGVAGASALSKSLTAPAAKDFLMHIGSNGQVKFAQRIDGADTVAVAAKAGGGISQATGKGGGGVTIIQHNYSGMEAVQKGYRALMAAKAL